MTTYLVQFATDRKFLGVAIVDLEEDADIYEVIDETIARGCNPGDGSVAVMTLKPDVRIPDCFKNRLLGEEEAQRMTSEVEALRAGGLH